MWWALAGCAEEPRAARPEPDPVTVDQVATRFTVAGADEGADLDGDGAPDNALAGLGPVVDPILAERLLTNVHVVVIQLADLDRWGRDDVRVGVFPAVDEDSDGADNASGTEAFDAEGYVDADGIALDGEVATLDHGAYTVFLPTDSFQVGDFRFDLVTGVHLTATASAAGGSGVAAIGVTTDALAQALGDEGVDPGLIALLAGLADLDLDGDGALETVSMAFRFQAATCGLTAAPTTL